MRKDEVTLDSPVLPAKRGRPKSATALDGAARQRVYKARRRAYRARMLADGKLEIDDVWVGADVKAALQKYVERHNARKAVELITLGDAVDRLLRGRLLRKR